MEQVVWARTVARDLLADALPRRWAHTRGVGHKAESIAHVVGGDAESIICAAWLHDVGYAPDLVDTGFHSLDGARYLRDKAKASDLVCRLVAHHSCAIVEARSRSLDTDLLDEFPPVAGIESDALLYCDMTTSPDGVPVSVESRLAEILTRYADGSIVAESIKRSGPEIVRVAKAVTVMLDEQGGTATQ